MKKRDPKTGRYVKLTHDDVPAAKSQFVQEAANFFERVEQVAGDRFHEQKVLNTGIVIPGKGPLLIGYYPARLEAALVVLTQMVGSQVR